MDKKDKLTAALTDLTGGAPLIVEDLDLSGMGLYNDEQRAVIVAAGGVDDFFMYCIMGGWAWMRQSEEGVKWHTYKDTGIIKPWK